MQMKRVCIIMFMLLSIWILMPKQLNANEITNTYEFWSQTEYKNVAHIITAMTVLETGWYKSNIHTSYNNPYSVKTSRKCTHKRPIKCMRDFESYNHAHRYMYIHYFKRQNYSRNAKRFYVDLVKKGYAEDKNYIKKVKSVIRSIERRNLI